MEQPLRSFVNGASKSFDSPRDKPENSGEAVLPYMNLIRRKAAKLSKQLGFGESDEDDLAQELTLKVLVHLRSFDPERGHLSGYISMLVDRAAANLVRDRQAQKRDHRRQVSLNARQRNSDGEAVELENNAHGRRTGQTRRDPFEKADLKLDLEDLLRQLPGDERRLARALSTYNLSNAATKLGISRTTATKRLKRLRKRCSDSPLREYLEKWWSLSGGAG